MKTFKQHVSSFPRWLNLPPRCSRCQGPMRIITIGVPRFVVTQHGAGGHSNVTRQAWTCDQCHFYAVESMSVMPLKPNKKRYMHFL